MLTSIPAGQVEVHSEFIEAGMADCMVRRVVLILEDGEAARHHFAALVHCTLNPHVPGHVRVGVASDGLSKVSLKEATQHKLQEVRN